MTSSVNLTFNKARSLMPAISGDVVIKGVLTMMPVSTVGAGQLLNIVYVIDRSGSMDWEGRLQAVKTALENLHTQLGPQDRVGVVAYDDTARIIVPLVGKHEYARYIPDIRGLFTGGVTAARVGLREAVTMLDAGDPAATKVIVLLTDGEETGVALGSGESADQKVVTAETMAADAVRGTGIHVIPIAIDPSVPMRFFDALIGAGPDPSAPLLPPQAALTATEIALVLVGLFKKVRSRIGTNLKLFLKPSPFMTLTSVYQVAPNLRQVAFTPDGDAWQIVIHDDLFTSGMTVLLEAEYESEEDAVGQLPFIEELSLTWDNVSTGQPETADLGEVFVNFVDPSLGTYDQQDDPAMADLIRTVLIKKQIDAGLNAATAGDMNASMAAFAQAASIAGTTGTHSNLASLAMALKGQAASGYLSAVTAGQSIARTSDIAQGSLDKLKNL